MYLYFFLITLPYLLCALPTLTSCTIISYVLSSPLYFQASPSWTLQSSCSNLNQWLLPMCHPEYSFYSSFEVYSLFLKKQVFLFLIYFSLWWNKFIGHFERMHECMNPHICENVFFILADVLLIIWPDMELIVSRKSLSVQIVKYSIYCLIVLGRQ